MSDKDSIVSFFKDPDASSVVSAKAAQIAAPIVRGQDLGADELSMGGGLRVVQFVLDRSPSMKDVAELLRNGFNDDFIPALKDAREDDISALRIGGTSFSSDIISIWKKTGPDGDVYYHSLDELPPISLGEYDPNRGHATALHEAILDGSARAMKFAAKQEGIIGMAPDVDIIVLTDGANNEEPRDPGVVKTMIDGRDKGRVRYIFFYFETDWGLGDPETYAVKELGFDGEQVQVFAKKQGEDEKERASRFRRMLRVMSRVSASKGTSAVKATAAVAQAGSDDDDLI